MTLAPVSLLATLTTILSLTSNVLAGAIACTSQGIDFSEGQFTSYIPAHIAQFAVDERGDCYGEEIIGDCVETINKSDGAQNFICDNGEKVSATFWITEDQCLNIEVDNQHYWCCGETLNTDGLAACGF